MLFPRCKLALLLLYGIWGAPPVWAGVRVTVPALEIGEVRAGVQVTRIFELVNDGPGNAEIVAVRGSCGCLNPQVEPRIIPPNGKAKLTLSINTLGQGAGPHSWSARLRCRADGKESDLSAIVKAHVITEITVQPAALTIVATGARTDIVTLIDLRRNALAVTSVETSTPGLKARLLSPGRDTQGRRTEKIQLDVTGELKSGRHVETLSIYTNDPVYQHLQVLVTIIKQSASSTAAVPDEVTLRPAPGQAASCLVRLHSWGAGAVRINKVETGDPALTCKWAEGPGQDATLRIQLDPAAWTGGELEATALIHLEGYGEEIVRLPIHVRRP
jgi:hypothetical protein